MLNAFLYVAADGLERVEFQDDQRVELDVEVLFQSHMYPHEVDGLHFQFIINRRPGLDRFDGQARHLVDQSGKMVNDFVWHGQVPSCVLLANKPRAAIIQLSNYNAIRAFHTYPGHVTVGANLGQLGGRSERTTK